MQKLGLRKVLILVGSAWAVGAGAQESGPPAVAPAANPEGTLEEVVVTGTSIRGVAPIGSNVITLDQTAIQATGAVNVSQMINSVPAITTANSAPQGKNVFDRAPPFYNGTTGGILAPGGTTPGSYGFNGFVSNPIGRLISAGFRVEL